MHNKTETPNESDHLLTCKFKAVPIDPTVIGDFRNIRGMKVVLIRKEHMPLAVFFYEIHDMTILTFVLVSKTTNKNSVGAVNSDTRRDIRTLLGWQTSKNN